MGSVAVVAAALPWQHVTTVPSPQPTRRYHAAERCCAHAGSVVTAHDMLQETSRCNAAPSTRMTAVVGG
jgi:hypothetical protein